MQYDRKIDVQLTDASKQRFRFGTVRDFCSFLSSEIRFWERQRKQIENQAEASKLHKYIAWCPRNFQAVLSHMDNWDEDEISNWDDGKLQRNFEEQIRIQLVHASTHWLSSENPCSTRFVEIHKEKGYAAATAFIDYVIGSSVSNLQSRESFAGTMLGYEYEHQDSDLVKRRKPERQALRRLTKRREENIEALSQDVLEFKTDFSTWATQTRGEWEEAAQLAGKAHEDLLESHQAAFDSRSKEHEEKICQLEQTYDEKLRLSEPVKHWKQCAKKYKRQGYGWTLGLAAALTSGVWWFSDMYQTWLATGATPIDEKSIPGIVLMGTIVAMFAYGVRVLGRMIFSCFHLMRDSEEKQQLTYLFLTLSREAGLDSASREIVLQSLFSRADSGLLGKDSSPAMPTPVDIARTGIAKVQNK